MNGGSGGTGGYAQEMWKDARAWLDSLYVELKALVNRVPPDVEYVKHSFAHRLERILKHIAILEYFLGEGTNSHIITRAHLLVENSLGKRR